MRIRAKYTSKCRLCGGPIEVGEAIDWVKGTKPAHVACTGRPSATGGRVHTPNLPSGTASLQYECTPEFEVYTVYPHELFDLVRTSPRNPHNSRLWGELKSYCNEMPHWSGGTQKENESRRDWPEGRRLMEQYRADLEHLPAVRSIKRVRRWSDNGDEFSRDRFDAGYADCWSARTRSLVRTSSGVLTITVGFGGSAGVEGPDLAWGGAAACVLVDRLEDAGYRCEVIACNATEDLYRNRDCGRPRMHVHRIIVKSADEPLDIDRMLLVTSCPGFFRYHTFRLCLEPDEEVCEGLGKHRRTPEALRGDIHFGDKIYTREAAQAEIDRIIAGFGDAGNEAA